MKFTVIENYHLAGATWLMRVKGDTSSLIRPGQFVNISVEGCFLRRPISVCDSDTDTITLVYDVVGKGTLAMTEMKPGTAVDMLSGLGNGFDPDKPCRHPMLVGGGIGIAPLVGLARVLLDKGVRPSVVLGYNSADKIVLRDMFENMGLETITATADGSEGIKGFVTDAIRESGVEFDYFYACGPMSMLEALCRTIDSPGELSLDVRMACGFGACMCCSLETTEGPVCVCKQGPVFDKNILIWKK